MLEELEEAARYKENTLEPANPIPFVRARRAQLAVALLFLVNGATVGSWVPHIPERAHALGLNPAQLGTVLLAGGIGGLAAMPLSGRFIRRFGSRRVATVTGFLFPVLMSLAILAPRIHLLASALFLAGLTASTMDVSMNAHGVLVERLLGRRTVSMFHAIFSLGCFAGAGLMSFLMARGLSNVALVPCFALVLVGVVLFTYSRLVHRSAEQAHHVEHHPPREKQPGLRAHLPHPGLLLLGMLCFSTMVSEGAMSDWSALFLHAIHHLPSGSSGYGYTCVAGCMVAGRLSGDWIVSKLGELRTLRAGGLLTAAGLLLILLTHPLPLVLAGFSLAGLGLANASPILYRTAATLPGFAPGEGLSTAVGVGYVGLLLGPPLLGFVGHAFGLPSIFRVLLGLSALLLAGAGLIHRAGRQTPVTAVP